ncbi:hypothetical protein B0H10DRAFT_2031003 [Mycena sp. CBHHK59/15]|nr:hypothetical protein B0H10DRAFT_2031003 [Mycena sp. CBHHK59/15]
MPQSLARPACMPLSLRCGVLAVAVIGLFSGLALSITGWVIVVKLNAVMSDPEVLAVDLHVCVYLLMIIFSTVGIYGALYPRHNRVSLFVSTLFVQILFSLGSGIFTLYLLFQKQSAEKIQQCITDTNAHTLFGNQICEKPAVLKGVAVALLLVICFIEILGLILGNSYSYRLRKAETEDQMTKFDDSFGRLDTLHHQDSREL